MPPAGQMARMACQRHAPPDRHAMRSLSPCMGSHLAEAFPGINGATAAWSFVAPSVLVDLPAPAHVTRIRIAVRM